jgi:hypothetical protein
MENFYQTVYVHSLKLKKISENAYLKQFLLVVTPFLKQSTLKIPWHLFVLAFYHFKSASLSPNASFSFSFMFGQN